MVRWLASASVTQGSLVAAVVASAADMPAAWVVVAERMLAVAERMVLAAEQIAAAAYLAAAAQTAASASVADVRQSPLVVTPLARAPLGTFADLALSVS